MATAQAEAHAALAALVANAKRDAELVEAVAGSVRSAATAPSPDGEVVQLHLELPSAVVAGLLSWPELPDSGT